MNERPDEPSDDELAETIRKFDELYGEIEKVLWCLSVHARVALLDGDGESPVLEALIWKIKSWWPVQGVRHETRPAMARALVTLEWSPELFEPLDTPPPGGEEYAVDLVATLVNRSMGLGVPRREYSLASKVLHLLLPWRIPVYDSFVRSGVGVPDAWDHPEAYARIVRELFRAARNVADPNPAWMGELEPRSLLRALDKYYWWVGGGHVAASPEVKDPWRIIDELGLDPDIKRSS